MYHFFNIESPLQLMSAISAAKKFNDCKCVLLINLSKGTRLNNDSQIMDLVNYDFWHDVIIHKKESGFLKDIRTAIKLYILKKKYANKINKYFFGEYRNFNMALVSGLIKPKERVLIDDGSFTITAQNYYIRNNIFPYSKSLKGKVFKSIIKENSRPNLYSFFKLDLLPGQVNYYEFPVAREVEINQEEVFFFGCKFSERKNMTLDNELDVLKNTIAYFSGKKVFYIPHRDEKKEKLVEIVKLGYFIKNLGKPAEIFFDETDVMPAVIASYYSTTLYSCFLRFSNVLILYVDVEDYLIKNNARISAREIYSYYKKIGISSLDFKF